MLRETASSGLPQSVSLSVMECFWKMATDEFENLERILRSKRILIKCVVSRIK